MSGGAVIASAITTHREIYADAAEFFDPYSIDDLVRSIHAVIDPHQSARRDELLGRGALVARRYSRETLLPKWQSFLESSMWKR